jgi:hypothetical protein
MVLPIIIVEFAFGRGAFSLGWFYKPGLKERGPRQRKAFSPGSKVEHGLKGRTKAPDSTSVSSKLICFYLPLSSLNHIAKPLGSLNHIAFTHLELH